VDLKTEAVIVEAMARLMHGRTTFFITHRSSALKHCNLVLRIEHGRVAGVDRVSATTDVEADGGGFGAAPQVNETHRIYAHDN
jgi:ABC-type transport system involved in cytochrome bd biosynthesis fused ATPase/permease subunit